MDKLWELDVNSEGLRIVDSSTEFSTTYGYKSGAFRNEEGREV
jgi:hypothetical protein